jgi:hypothetical protein
VGDGDDDGDDDDDGNINKNNNSDEKLPVILLKQHEGQVVLTLHGGGASI